MEGANGGGEFRSPGYRKEIHGSFCPPLQFFDVYDSFDRVDVSSFPDTPAAPGTTVGDGRKPFWVEFLGWNLSAPSYACHARSSEYEPLCPQTPITPLPFGHCS